MSRRFLWSAFVLVFGCAPWRQPAEFPRENRAWTVPLVSPLSTNAVRVMLDYPFDSASMPARTFVIDSGAEQSMMTREHAQLLNLPVSSSPFVRVVDANNERGPWQGVVVPELRLGELELRDVTFALSGEFQLLGGNILNEREWSVDFDEGTLTFGASRSSEAPVATFELHRFDASFGSGDYVEVRIHGERALLLFDTGAMRTTVTREMAELAGIDTRGAKESTIVRSAHSIRQAHAFGEVAVSVGTSRPRAIEVLEHHSDWRLRNGERLVGLLGMDFLSTYNFRVVPHQRVELYARRRMDVTAADRIERWSWVPECEVTGCVRAGVVAVHERSIDVALQFSQRYDRAARFAFACATDSGEIMQDAPLVEVTLRSESVSEDRIIQVSGYADPADRVQVGALSECKALRLVDVNPAPQSGG